MSTPSAIRRELARIAQSAAAKPAKVSARSAGVFSPCAKNNRGAMSGTSAGSVWASRRRVCGSSRAKRRASETRRSCGEGAHGRRIYDWARVEVRPWHREDRRHWVIARRSVSRPEEISYYIAYCPAGATLDQLIRIAGSRWAVEECFQSAKQECGLDDYQVRRYPGWHRHMTLAMAAHACLTVLRARQLDTEKAETDPASSSTSASLRSDG